MTLRSASNKKQQRDTESKLMWEAYLSATSLAAFTQQERHVEEFKRLQDEISQLGPDEDTKELQGRLAIVMKHIRTSQVEADDVNALLAFIEDTNNKASIGFGVVLLLLVTAYLIASFPWLILIPVSVVGESSVASLVGSFVWLIAAQKTVTYGKKKAQSRLVDQIDKIHVKMQQAVDNARNTESNKTSRRELFTNKDTAAAGYNDEPSLIEQNHSD
eukprot:scaffold34601_cov234-Amphora_coffeaeformis.AAC.17